MSGALQGRRPDPEELQRGDSIAAQRTQRLARAGNAQQRDEACLARARILSCRLADLLRAAFGVQEVVGNLEGKPEGARVGSQGLALGRRGPPQDRAGVNRELDQRTRLQGLNPANAAYVL